VGLVEWISGVVREGTMYIAQVIIIILLLIGLRFAASTLVDRHRRCEGRHGEGNPSIQVEAKGRGNYTIAFGWIS